MITEHCIPCGDCPHLRTETWPGERLAVMCASPESPYAHPRVLSVTPGHGAAPGALAIRQRWCHDKTKPERRTKWKKKKA